MKCGTNAKEVVEHPAFMFFGAIIGLTIGVPLLALYEFGMFRYGQGLAERVPTRISDRNVLIVISLAWLPVTSIVLLLPGDPFFKVLLWVIVYLMNAYPSAVGLISRRQYLEDQEVKRHRRNVDVWLADWECKDAEATSEDDWKAILQSGEDESN